MLIIENKVVNCFFYNSVTVARHSALIALFFLFASGVSAQVSTLTAWTLAYHGTSTTAQTATVTVPAGSATYRCIVVAIASNQTVAAARTVTLTYGGQTFTSVAGDMATATVQQHTQLYYLNEAGIDAASNTTLSVTVSGGTTLITDVWYSIYDGVDQTSPITDSKTYSSGTGTTANPVFASALTVNTNDLAVEVISSHRTASATPRTITYATNWTMADEETNLVTQGVRNAVVNRSIPSSNTTDVSSTTINTGPTLASMTGLALNSIPKMYRSNTASVTWATAGNWEQSGNGGTTWVTATSAPTSSDGLVTIRNGHTVTLGAAATANALTIDAGGALTTSATAANTLTVSGATIVNGTITLANTGTHTFSGDVTIGGTWNETAAAVVNIAGNFTNNAASFTASTGAHTLSGVSKAIGGTTTTSIPSLTFTSSYTNSGIITSATLLTVTTPAVLTNNGTVTATTALSGTGGLTQGSSATLNIGGTSGITALTASASGNTVNYTGAAQTIFVTTYHHLGLSGSGAKTFAVTTLNGNLTLSGTATATTGAAITIGGSLTVGTGTTFATGNTNSWTLGVIGNTSITGTLTLANTGTKTFTGDVAVNSGGVWNETGAATINLAGNFTNNATSFTASTGTHGFSGASKIISGSTSLVIPTITFTGSYTNNGTITSATLFTITSPAVLTNNGTVTATTALSGTGGLTQGTTGVLNITGTSLIATLTASASGNTVNYNGTAQTLKVVTYHHLALAGSGAKTCAVTTVNGNMSVSGTATVVTGAALAITGTLSIGNGTTFTAAGFALTVTGNTTVGSGVSGSLVISSGTGTKAFNGDFTVSSGATFTNTAANVSLTLPGSFSNSGTFNGGTGTYTFSGATKTIGGTTSIANVAVSGTYTNIGTLTVSTALTGAGTLTQGASSTLNIGGTSTITGLAASTNTNTVNYTLVGSQTVKAVNYSSLGISGGSSNIKTLGGSITVSGTLSIAAATTLSFGNTAITLTLSGTGANTLASANATTSIIDMSGSNAAHVLQIAASSITTFGTVTPGTGSTIEYNASGAQTVFVRTYNHLKLSGSGAKTFAVTTISGNLELSGTATATTGAALALSGSLTVGNGTTFTAGAFALTVTGNAIVGGGTSGILTISSATGTKAFNGNFTVNAGATFNNTSANVSLTLPGNFSNSGTFNGGSGTYTFSGSTKTIGGTVTIANVSVSGTYTNTGNLTVTTLLGGAGTFEMGLSSSLNITGAISVTTFDASANGSVVTYNGSSAQTIKSATYDDLTINNSHASGATLAANTTVEGTLTFTQGNLSVSTFNLTVQGVISGATSARFVKTTSTGKLIQTVGASPVTFPVGNTAYNPIILTNSGTTDDYGIRVVDAVTTPAPASTAFLVNRYWNITEAVAGGSDLSFTAQWNSGEPNGSYASGTTVKAGYYNGSGWMEYATTQSGAGPFTAVGSFSVTGDDLTTERTLGIGKDAGFISGATITVSSVSTFGNQCTGTTSAEKTYTVFGVNLSTDILITPPSGYQISTTSGSGFVSTPTTITLTQSDGKVDATTIYVRFTPGSVATFNSNITHTSTGATTKNVALTGAGVNSTATITSPTSASIATTTVTLGGNITDIGCSSVTERGIYWSTTNGFTPPGQGTKVSATGSFGTGAFTQSVTGLTANTTYYYKAFATNSGGTVYSSQGTFTTVSVAKYSVGGASVDWANTSSWSLTSGGTAGAAVPANGEAVFIEGNRTVTISSANTTTLNAINIASGSTLTTSSTRSVTAGTITVNGTFNCGSTGTLTASTALIINGVFNRTASQTFTVTGMTVNSGGKYTHATTATALPTATWNANSTCEITGRTGNAITGLNQTFGHFIWNCTGQITSAQSLPDAGTMTIVGNLTIGSTGTQSLVLNQTSLSAIHYTHTTGTFNLNSASSGTKTLNVSGNYSHTSGTLTHTGNGSSRGAVVFNGTTTQTFTSGGTLGGTVDYTINNGATVDFGTNTITSGSAGTFDLLAGGTLITANTAGVSTTAATGTVQVTGIKSYSDNANSNYVFNGSLAQVTGNGYTGGGDLTINNAAGVKLTGDVSVNGMLNIGTITSNTIFEDNGKIINPNITGTLNLVSGTYKLGSTGAATVFPAYATIIMASGTTVEYASGQIQTVSVTPSYRHLTFSGNGQKNVSGSLDVSGNWSTTGGLASMGTTTAVVAGNVTGNGNITFTSGTLNTQGNWTNTGTLTPGTGTVTFDGSGAQAIGSGTAVSFNNLNISNAGTKTMGAAISTSGIFTIDNGLILSTANFDITLTGDLINNGTINAGSSIFTIAGTTAQSIDRFTTTGAISMTKTGGTATFINDVSGGSLTINGTGGTLSLGAGNTVTISGNWTNTSGTLMGGSSTLLIGGSSNSFGGGTFTSETGTVEYNAVGAQTMAVAPYFNLTMSGSGAKLGAVTTIGGDLTLSGTATSTTGAALAIGGTLNIGDGTTFTAAGFGLTVTGATTVGGGTGGNLTISSSTGAKTFSEDFTVNAGATFSNTSSNSPVTFAGSISNAGTFNAGTGVYTLSGADRSIIGTLAIPSIAMTGSYTNEGSLTVATALTGSGSLVQALNAVLNIGGTATVSSIDAGTVVNTVNFTGTSGGQSIPGFVAYNLILSNTSSINTMTGSLTVNNTLTLSGGKLALGSNTLTLNANISGMTDSSCFTANGSSSINIGGSGALGTNLFLDQSNRGTTNRLASLTYNRSSVTITLGDTVEITGAVTPTTGTLATSDKLKLISNASGTACVMAGSGSYITGNVTAERFIPSSARRWRFGGAIVSGRTMADLKDDIFITGPDGAANGFDVTLTNYAGVYSYDESVTSGDLNSGWIACGNITDSFTVGRGFRIFVRGDRDPGRLDGSITTQNEVTLDLVGPLNIGNITIPVTYTSSGSAPNDGWNLVANPYACQIDWNMLHDAGRTGIDSNFSGADYAHIKQTVYSFDATTNSYTSYNALSNTGTGNLSNGIIPAGAAFWVQAVAASPSLTIKEVYKTNNTPAAIFKTAAERFIIKLVQDSITSDEAIIQYMPQASDFFDVYDISKMYGSDVNIASIAKDGSFLSANCKPFNGVSDTIPLSVGFANSGTYKMEFNNPGGIGLEATQTIFLVDVYTKQVKNLNATAEYTFTVDKNNSATYGNSRFMLVVGDNITAVPEISLNEPPVELYLYPASTVDMTAVYSKQHISGNAQVSITDLQGKFISITNTSWVNDQLPVDLSDYQTGLYFISIKQGARNIQTFRCVKN